MPSIIDHQMNRVHNSSSVGRTIPGLAPTVSLYCSLIIALITDSHVALPLGDASTRAMALISVHFCYSARVKCTSEDKYQSYVLEFSGHDPGVLLV